MVKATAWKYQKCVCARPALKRCPGTTLAASGTHTHRAARTPGGAENLLLQLGAQRGSGAVTVALTGQCAMAQLLLSPGLQHILHLAALCVEAKTFWAPSVFCSQKGRLPALWTLSTSGKQTHSQENNSIVLHVFFSTQTGPVALSGPVDGTLCDRTRTERYS